MKLIHKGSSDGPYGFGLCGARVFYEDRITDEGFTSIWRFVTCDDCAKVAGYEDVVNLQEEANQAGEAL